MKDNIQLISTDYLKRLSSIEENVDNDKIIPFIIKVQDTYLQQALGSSFFYDIKNKAKTSSLNSDEEELVRSYIQPMIAEYTVYESLPFLNYKITNRAVSTENTSNSQPSNLDVIKYMRSNVKNTAEFYRARLIKHLCDYSNLFDKYINPDAKENLHKKNKSYQNGIYIPRSRGGGYDMDVYDDRYK